MTIKNIKRTFALLQGLFLVIFAVNSCTYDYFVDETNFRLYVPQIHAALYDQGAIDSDVAPIDGEEVESIERFYVAFHRMGDGAHLLTREVTAPFEPSDYIDPGVLRFKLPPGQYRITCWADYTPGMLTEGKDLSSSHKATWLYDADRFMYNPSTSQPRVLFLDDVTVYPLGSPETLNPVTANMDQKCEFKSTVACRFEGLNDLGIYFSRIETTYIGSATKLCFDGIFAKFNDGDVIYDEILTPNLTTDDRFSYSRTMFPSAGMEFIPQDEAEVYYDGTGDEIEVNIKLYDHTGALSGSLTVNSEELTRLLDEGAINNDDLPEDENGNKITDLVLYPRKTITFVFRGLVFVGVELTPWGEIEDGEVILH